MTEAHSDGGRERRRHERFALRAPVVLVVDGREHAGTLRDISAGGAAVSVRTPVTAGTPVTLAMGEFGAFAAFVVRAGEEGFVAVRFAIDADAMARLAKTLMTMFHGAEAPCAAAEPDIPKHPLTP